ncbi:MAG TPA: molybdopterin-dependent oxidoreductase [Elusimicrobiota bacterium]|nr:molybdopterin-dependent oxidoreductase [Elusimicrobiota bacterium]
MAKFTLNGKTIEAEPGVPVLEAALQAGVDIPYYCYHPALGNPGNCRMCVVEVEGMPKPAVSCRLPVKEGLVVRSDSEAAKRWQSSSLELHLVNHPLDCPVCDQSGECGLQDYYLKVGRYQSQVREDKEHKEKRKQIGEHVMLDQERCILCTRCTRFTEEVTKTNELGVFSRGHKEVIDLAPGRTLDNAYSGNVVDVCPVGALTDRDFRYKVRVWYLDRTPSICPGCSRGCSIEVHTNTTRPWHFEGRRVVRLKPRHNSEVNGYWMCDEGRYGFKNLDEDRIGRVMQLKPAKTELPWDEALTGIARALKGGIEAKGAKGLAVISSGMLSNEDWAEFKKLFVDALGVTTFLFKPEPDQLGEEDDLLRKKEKVPNLKGGEALGFGAKIASASWGDLAKKIQAKEIWGLYIIERDAVSVWAQHSREGAQELLSRLDVSVFQGPHKTQTGDHVGYRLPATAYVEEDGHFTNFEGKAQAYRKALEPLGAARPDWKIFKDLGERLKAKDLEMEAAAR